MSETCEAQGRHIRGHDGKCLLCGVEVEPQEGPIEILCKEIGFRFDKKLESVNTLVSFVSVLVSEISRMRWVDEKCVPMTGKEPTENSAKAITLISEVLSRQDRDLLIKGAAEVHGFVNRVTPDEGPRDHMVDMVSSCASAIRFGLERPCRSRHAAAAANHIWQHVYGIRTFDCFTGNWQKEWTRAKLHQAMIERLL